MKTATGLTLLAVGAVLAFAVHGHPWFLNLQVVGWIIIAVGVIGLAVPRRGYGWLRQRVVTRRLPDGRTAVGTQQRAPQYIAINPAAVETDTDAEVEAMPDVPPVAGVKSWGSTETVVPDEETVKEYFAE
jgi:hypothetical protein